MLTWIKEKIAAAWNWSRTVFINAAAVLAMASVELIAYALGINWREYLGDYWGGVVAILLGVANIVIRVKYTTGPVGTK